MNRFRFVALSACVVLLLSACAGGGSSSSGVAATVNGHDIPTSEVQDATTRYAATDAFNQQAQSSSASAVKRQFEQSWLSRLIRRQVLAPLAAKRGISVTAKDVDERLQKIKAANFKTDAEYKHALAQQGLTEPILKQLIADSVIEKRLHAEVVAPAVPTSKQLKAYYFSHVAQYRQTRASQILVKNQRLALNLSQRLRSLPKKKLAAVFLKLARKYSIDKTSAKQGGDLGFVSSGQFVPEFESAESHLKVGQVSTPVHTQFGFHVIWVTARRTQPYSKVSSTIKSSLSQQEGTVWTSYLQRAFGNADIRVNSTYGHFDIATQQVVNDQAGDVPGTETPSATPTEPAGTPSSGTP